MHWLNSNSGAIQALSSVLIVGLTAVLAYITLRYVRLTQDLLSVQREAAAVRRRELRAHVGVLQSFLSELHGPDDNRLPAEILSHARDLHDFPFDRLRALASEVSVEAGAKAVEAEKHLNWLASLIRSIRASLPRKEPPRSVNEPLSPTLASGYDWKNFPGRDYDTAWRFGSAALTGLLMQVDAADKREAL
jgi:hypothetical protein